MLIIPIKEGENIDRALAQANEIIAVQRRV